MNNLEASQINRALFEYGLDYNIVLNANLEIQSYNQNALIFYGLSEHDNGKVIYEAIDFSEQEIFQTTCKKASSNLQSIQDEVLINTNGIIRKITFNLSPIINEKEIIKAFIFSSKLYLPFANQASYEQDYFLASIIDQIPEYIFWKDTSSVYLGCNKNFATLVGFESSHDITGKRDTDFPWKTYGAHIYQHEDKELLSGNIESIETEHELNVLDNKRIYISISKRLLFKEGSLIGVIGICKDITNKKLHEKALKEAKDNLELANQGLTLIAASIAHELRTPLLAIASGIRGINKYLPRLIDSYQIARSNNLIIPYIPLNQAQYISNSCHNIIDEVSGANSIINHLLMNINTNNINRPLFKKYSIRKCITEALKRYPKSQLEDELVSHNLQNDFIFFGNDLLIVHVFFNLLKNAFYYINSAQKGSIIINLIHTINHNIVIFKDTGKGIPIETLPYIFDKFYSRTVGGAGIGLAFCKKVMQELNGDIACHSVEGEYTEFILYFPVIK